MLCCRPHDHTAFLRCSRPCSPACWSRPSAGVRASARLGDDEERAGLRARRHDRPACAMPGPSTTCSRPSPRRASTARRRASSPARSWQPLAKVNVESLKEYDYFTYAKANGKKADFVDPPPDYYLDYKDTMLTLHFTLPFKTPVKAQGARARSLRSELFRRLRLRREGSGGAGRRAGGMQARPSASRRR